ncbi:MAG TPA: dodecin family protein [Clostridia bacterium]|nr:dodecin family protein [Clostridia bacterium]
MAVVKVIEILAQSPKGWEDAAQEALNEVAKTIDGIQSLYVRDFQAVVENNRIVQYRLNVKMSFLVRDEQRDK